MGKSRGPARTFTLSCGLLSGDFLRRFVRFLSAGLLVVGVGLIGWALLVWQWQDPITFLLMRRDQRVLAKQFEEQLAAYRPPVLSSTSGGVPTVAVQAARYRQAATRGAPIARLRIPKLGLDVVVVNGTDRDTLRKGPGRHLASWMPGEGQLVYVAGHRTTYGAPFSRIDRLGKGDRVTIELPYGRFAYSVVGRRIVPATFLQVLESRGRDELALQACWPRFSARQRIIVYARLAKATPRARAGASP